MSFRRILFVFALSVVFVGAVSAKLEQYRDSGATYLSDRLQMHWQTHATTSYIKGEFYDHAGGGVAPVPTVQMSGARSHVTDFRRPHLTELPPRAEDSRGMWLYHKTFGTYQWAPLAETGGIINSINWEIAGLAKEAAERSDSDSVYAEIAWNILWTYMQGILYTEMPVDIQYGHMQTIVGLQTFEVIHEDIIARMSETYQILRENQPAYFTPERVQTLDDAFRHWADIIIANGVPHNNWDIIQARFILAAAAALRHNEAYADGKGQEYYLDVVLHKDFVRQWSLKTLTECGYDASNGIWKECAGYSMVVLTEWMETRKLYAQITGRDLLDELPILRKAACSAVEYLFPDSMLIGFGDTHPHALPRRTYEGLGICMDSLPAPSPIFYAPKASWLVARTGMERDNDLAFALNGSLGNHMHANGISLELYGCGQRIAPDAGIGYSLYSGDDYKEYYSRFPAHNTVCVDGVSDYAVMMSHHAFELVDTLQIPFRERKAYAAEVYMIEPETHADQQRLVVMTDDYFVDIFRSARKDGKDKFHDYFYHNMGQEMSLSINGKHIVGTPSTDLAFAGGHLYAYSYIYNVYAEAVKERDIVRAHYGINGDSIVMTQWIQGANDSKVYRALSPSTEGLSRMKNMPYDIRTTPTLTLVVRRQGEAWTKPFVSVFEPSSAQKPAVISKVEFPDVRIKDKQTRSAVAVLITRTDGHQDLIISTDNENAKVQVNGKTYKGRLNIVNYEL